MLVPAEMGLPTDVVAVPALMSGGEARLDAGVPDRLEGKRDWYRASAA